MQFRPEKHRPMPLLQGLPSGTQAGLLIYGIRQPRRSSAASDSCTPDLAELASDSCASPQGSQPNETLARRHFPSFLPAGIILAWPRHKPTLDASQAPHPCPSRSGHAKQAQQMADITQARPAAPRLAAGQSRGQSQSERQMPSQTACERMQRHRNRLRPHHPRRRQQPGQPAMAFRRLP